MKVERVQAPEYVKDLYGRRLDDINCCLALNDKEYILKELDKTNIIEALKYADIYQVDIFSYIIKFNIRENRFDAIDGIIEWLHKNKVYSNIDIVNWCKNTDVDYKRYDYILSKSEEI